MDFADCHIRVIVYHAVKLAKPIDQTFCELQLIVGEAKTPILRTLQRWAAEIRKGTFLLEKGHSAGRPRLTRTSD